MLQCSTVRSCGPLSAARQSALKFRCSPRAITVPLRTHASTHTQARDATAWHACARERTHACARRAAGQSLVYYCALTLQVSSVFCALNTHKLVSAEQAGVRVKLGVVAVSRRLLVQMVRYVSARPHGMFQRRGGGDEGLGEGDSPCPLPLPLPVLLSFPALSLSLPVPAEGKREAA